MVVKCDLHHRNSMQFTGNDQEESSKELSALFSRDVIFHVSDKTTLFNNFYTWLKDEGRVLITDFCCGNTPFSQDLIDYARSGMYTLTSIQEYTEVCLKWEEHCLSEIIIAFAKMWIRTSSCGRLFRFISTILSARDRNCREESSEFSFGK